MPEVLSNNKKLLLVVVITFCAQFSYADIVSDARGSLPEKKCPPIHLESESWITPVDAMEGIPIAHIQLMHSRERTLRWYRVCCVGLEDLLVASVTYKYKKSERYK